MDVTQEENQEVEVQPQVEEGSLEALKEKAEGLNSHEPEESVDEETPVAEAKPETTEEVAAELAQPDVAEYKPSYKYVHKGQELEVDEFLRPLVKDADTEKKIQEISQKLAFVEDTKEIRQKWESAQETLNMVNECQRLYEEGVNEGNVGKLERLMETIGVSEEQIYEIAKAKLARRQMDPQQREALEKQRKLELDYERVLRENEQYQSQTMAESRRAVELEIEQQLARQDVQDLRGAYEQVHGVGSFKNLLIQEGHVASVAQGQTVPPGLVMEGIIRQYGPFLRQQAASQQPITPQVIQQTKKVVTNVSATGASPSRSSINSLDDIRKIREQRFGQE